MGDGTTLSVHHMLVFQGRLLLLVALLRLFQNLALPNPDLSPLSHWTAISAIRYVYLRMLL